MTVIFKVIKTVISIPSLKQQITARLATLKAWVHSETSPMVMSPMVTGCHNKQLTKAPQRSLKWLQRELDNYLNSMSLFVEYIYNSDWK